MHMDCLDGLDPPYHGDHLFYVGVCSFLNPQEVVDISDSMVFFFLFALAVPLMPSCDHGSLPFSLT